MLKAIRGGKIQNKNIVSPSPSTNKKLTTPRQKRWVVPNTFHIKLMPVGKGMKISSVAHSWSAAVCDEAPVLSCIGQFSQLLEMQHRSDLWHWAVNYRVISGSHAPFLHHLLAVCLRLLTITSSTLIERGSGCRSTMPVFVPLAFMDLFRGARYWIPKRVLHKWTARQVNVRHCSCFNGLGGPVGDKLINLRCNARCVNIITLISRFSVRGDKSLAVDCRTSSQEECWQAHQDPVTEPQQASIKKEHSRSVWDVLLVIKTVLLTLSNVVPT